MGGFAAKPGLLSGLKSGVSVFDTIKKMAAAPPPALSGLAGDLSDAARVTFDSTPHLPANAKLLFAQMVEFGVPDAQEIVAANLQAGAICDTMLAKLNQIEHTRPPMPALFRKLTVPALEAVLAEKSFTDDLMPAWMANVSGSLAHIQQVVDQLKAQSDKTARELGISQGLVIALARRYAEGSPDDFDGALAGLEHALETAAEEREKGQLPGNVSDAVDAVMARVDALNEAGEIDAAEAALVAEIERQEAAQARLIDKGLTQAVLTRNVDLAVRLEVKRLGLDGGGFDDLRGVRNDWYERGRDKGLRFDLEVAISLAEESIDRADGPDQRGNALNDLGIAQETLGARESGTDRLRESVATHRNALKERTRVRVPLDYAVTQNNLGNALLSLGQRESGAKRLHEAIAAFREVLKVYTREEYTVYWARTQTNLGNAMLVLATRDESTSMLHAAIRTYRKALEVLTREQDILHRANTLSHMGNALRIRGVHESNTFWLHKAVAAYCEALGVWTREHMPLRQAITQFDLCIVERALFEKTGLAIHLDKAQVHLDAAEEVFVEKEMHRGMELAKIQQAQIDMCRAE